ncbi:glycosyltransferase family 39 protein [Candidatus Woesearchaeota archaeon]|nr:glycosyltransferase family 39 protein [Candidatus Woesearchaeota archaeon]
MDYKGILFPVALFLVAFYVWTLPIQESRLPFGEGDAAWHFGVGDFISSQDKTIDRLPPYIGYWYYLFNPVLGPFALEYPPSNHVNYAFMQAFGGDRFASVYIFKAITSFLGVFSVYFLVSRLYGSIAGFAAGLGLSFSSREITTYLWGQQPTLLSVVIVPVVLYSFFMYLSSVFEGKPRNVYLYVTSLLLASQYLLHIQGVLVSVFVMGIFAVAMVLKYKRVPFRSISLVHLGICLLMLGAVVLPFLMIYFGPESDLADRGSFSRLFSWTIDPKLQSGAYPDSFFSFSSNYGVFLLPFIMAGVVFLLVRRKDQDVLMLSWILAIYVILHFDVFFGASIVRVARMLIAEPQLFFALSAIGAVGLAGMVRVPGIDRAVLRLVFSSVLVLLIIFTIGISSFGFLKSAYASDMRVSDAELEASSWISSNLPEDAVIYNVGTITYPKMRFMHVVSGRFTNNKDSGFSFGNVSLVPTHYLFDYSDVSRFKGFEGRVEQMKAFEKSINGTVLYDRNGIKIFEVKNV